VSTANSFTCRKLGIQVKLSEKSAPVTEKPASIAAKEDVAPVSEAVAETKVDEAPIKA
jgi:hypothetical protein